MRSVVLATVLSLSLARSLSANSITIGIATAGNAFPFGGQVGGNPGTQYQQAYSATDFSGLGPIRITSIDFLGGRGTLATSNYSFSFSTITAGIDTLSNSNLNSNLGADNSFFSSLALSGSAPTTLTITGSSPFLYDPSKGNLLLNITVSPGGVDANGGSAGANYLASNGNATGIYSRYQNFGGGTIGWGLVTQFDFTATVPEPSTFVLSAIGFGCLLACRAIARRQLHL